MPSVLATGSDVEALRELRRTRRRNRLADVHWIDALYRAYLAALGAVLFVLFASGQLPDDRVTTESARDFAMSGAAWLGLAFAVAAGIGARSGGRGGPLVLEAPVVVHELQAPIERGSVLRAPAVKQLRFLAFTGAVAGGIVGEVAARRLPVNVAAAIAAGAATFALATLLAAGLAMLLSGRRVGWLAANLAAAALIGWSTVDVALEVTTSPLTLLAQLAFWPIEVQPLALVGVAAALAVTSIGFVSLPGMSIEHALRRAGLVSQLRFAVTLQDVRTVVLLRRQLSQERPRAQPWFRLRRPGRLPAVWRRDWQSILRFPAVRLARMVVLAAGAGLAMGAVWRGATAMIVVAGLALYIASYDASEAIAQEVDHPTRWESYPMEPGRLLLQHLPATFAVMLVLSLIASAAALALVPVEVVVRLAPPLLLPVAGACTFAAATGSAQGAPDTAGLIGLGPDLLGVVLMARLVLPPTLVVVALLPALAAGTDASALDVAAVSNAVFYPLIPLVGAYLWLRLRKPKHL